MKKALLGGFLLSLALLLTGCINYAEEISLNPDGSGTWLVDYSVSEEMMDQSEGMTNESFDTAEIEKDFEGKELKLDKVDTFSKDGFRHVVMEISFTDVSQLVEFMEDREFKFTANEDGSYTFYSMMPDDGGMMDSEELSVFTWKTVVKFPGEVLETTGEAKGGTVTWDLSLPEVSGTEMSVTYVPAALGSGMMMWYLLGGIILVIVVALISFKKKK